MTVGDPSGKPRRTADLQARVRELEDRQRQLETELDATRQRARTYHQLYDASLSANAVLADDGTILEINRGFAESLGFTREKLIGKNILAYVVPDHRTSVIDRIRMAFESMTVPALQFDVIGRDGPLTFWVAAGYADIREFNSRPGILIGAIDITERIQLESEREDTETRYRHLFNTISDAILIHDPETGEILEANEAALRLYQYTRREMRQMNIVDISTDPQATWRSIRSARGEGLHRISLRYHRRQDGTVFPAEIYGSATFQNGRRVMCGVIRDITDHVERENALRDSERRFRTIVETVPGIIWMTRMDEQFTPMFLSGDIRETFGYSKEDFLADRVRFADLVLPEDLERVEKEVSEALAARRPYSIELRFLRADGDMAWIEESGAGVFDDSGQVQYLIGSLLDITERKQSEQALQESEAKYRTLAENTGDLVYSMDAAGLLTYVGPQVGQYGYTVADVVGRPMAEFVAPEDRERAMTEFQRSVTTGEDIPSELRLLDADGGPHWFEDRSRALRDEHGRIVGITGILRDISDRHAAAQQMRDHLRFLETLLDTIPNPVFFKDTDGVYRGCNVAFAEHVMGMPRNEVVGRRVTDFSDWLGGQGEFFHRQDEALLADGGTQFYESRLKCADGIERDFFFNKATYTDASGELAGIVGVMLDITERKRSEQAIRGAHRKLMNAREAERKRLARELHDSISQSLVALQLEMQGVVDLCGECQNAGRLTAAAERCKAIIQELRGICHGLYPPTLEPLGLVSAMGKLVESISASMETRVDLDESIERGQLSPDEEIALFRIAQEAVNNALRHSRGESLGLSLQRRNEQVVLTVADDGIGFDIDVEEQRGMGIHSMRERAQALGGALSVRSGPGRTEIQVRVPIRRRDDSPAEPVRP